MAIQRTKVRGLKGVPSYSQAYKQINEGRTFSPKQIKAIQAKELAPVLKPYNALNQKFVKSVKLYESGVSKLKGNEVSLLTAFERWSKPYDLQRIPNGGFSDITSPDTYRKLPIDKNAVNRTIQSLYKTLTPAQIKKVTNLNNIRLKNVGFEVDIIPLKNKVVEASKISNILSNHQEFEQEQRKIDREQKARIRKRDSQKPIPVKLVYIR